jgi:hypothetical protein
VNNYAAGAPVLWNDDFVKRCGTAFCLGGSTFPFIGFNSYNLMVDQAANKDASVVQEVNQIMIIFV